MNINWYPGHMVKAKREINESLKLVDMVIELMDARIPNSSVNPDFQRMFNNKIRVAVLNKSDYADTGVTDRWIDFYQQQDLEITYLNALNRRDIKRVKSIVFKLADKKHAEIKARKGINKTIRAMVVGIPNVGKSTFINSFAGSGKAKTGDRPGVTKGKQWVKVTPYFELLDTPGLLWPRLDKQETGLHLAYTGAIKQEILDNEQVAYSFLAEISGLYPDMIVKRYGIQPNGLEGHQLLEAICRSRGWLMPGGGPDINRGSRQVLDEFQSGTLGRMTLETPS